VPQHLPLANPAAAGLARRHYLRVSGDAHPGLARRIESLVRRTGLSVQNRAARAEQSQVHLGFMISTSPDTAIAQVRDAIAKLARVTACISLGILE
jgi:hypothetical protein